MRRAARHRVPGVAALLLAFAALAALVLAVAWLSSPATRVKADFPHAGLDFSIGVGTQCDSTAGPTTCNVGIGEAFTVDFKLNTLPDDIGIEGDLCSCYESEDATIGFFGVNVIQASLVQQGSGVWPDCANPASDFTTNQGELGAGCTVAAGVASSSYTGVLMHVDFQCAGPAAFGIIGLFHGEGKTDIVRFIYSKHGEEQDSSEQLAINCGNVPTPTPTVGTPGLATPTPTTVAGATPTPTTAAGATPTPTRTPTSTPTITPTPTFTVTPTPTRRPQHTLLGDVDGDLSVDARDALWVLWFDARIVVDVPIPEAADVNGDDIVNVRDALYILWVQSGVIEQP